MYEDIVERINAELRSRGVNPEKPKRPSSYQIDEGGVSTALNHRGLVVPMWRVRQIVKALRNGDTEQEAIWKLVPKPNAMVFAIFKPTTLSDELKELVREHLRLEPDENTIRTMAHNMRLGSIAYYYTGLGSGAKRLKVFYYENDKGKRKIGAEVEAAPQVTENLDITFDNYPRSRMTLDMDTARAKWNRLDAERRLRKFARSARNLASNKAKAKARVMGKKELTQEQFDSLMDLLR